jgi:hypothetical protein
MYRKSKLPSTPPENFELPFEGKLSQDNRWVIMANLIPWSEFEAEYASLFSEEMGAPAKTFRIAMWFFRTYNVENSPSSLSVQQCSKVDKYQSNKNSKPYYTSFTSISC